MAPSHQDLDIIPGSSSNQRLSPGGLSPKELWDPLPPQPHTPLFSVLVEGVGSGTRMLGSNLPLTS